MGGSSVLTTWRGRARQRVSPDLSSKPWGCRSSGPSARKQFARPHTRVAGGPSEKRRGARLAYGHGWAYRVRMTTAAKVVWILIGAMLVLSLLGAVSLTLISPG